MAWPSFSPCLHFDRRPSTSCRTRADSKRLRSEQRRLSCARLIEFDRTPSSKDDRLSPLVGLRGLLGLALRRESNLASGAVRVTLLDEIQTETWHILTATYVHQRLVEGFPKGASRYELANQLVAINALREMLMVRIARLADKGKKLRSVSMLLKRGSLEGTATDVREAAKRFLSLAEPVVKIRHEQIAHMMPGILSSLEPQILPAEAIKATEALVDLVDTSRGKPVSYTYKVGSIEQIIDLRASLVAGEAVFV